MGQSAEPAPVDVAPRSFEETMYQITELKSRLNVLVSDTVVKPPTRNLSTWDFYIKTNITGEWQDCRKWIEIRKIVDLPSKFRKGTIVTLKGMSKVQVKDVFRLESSRT